MWPSALALAGLPLVLDIPLAHPDAGLAGTVRDTLYVGLVIGSEFLMLGTALASFAFLVHQRRAAAAAAMSGREAR